MSYHEIKNIYKEPLSPRIINERAISQAEISLFDLVKASMGDTASVKPTKINPIFIKYFFEAPSITLI
jgi:hypothetical protein